jgi:hypothetical protein
MAPSERAEQMRRDAEGGSLDAQTWLGRWHFLGEEGLEQNLVEAAALFRTAADLGHAPAQFALCGCYHEGMEVLQSYALAAEWGRKAADQGKAAAQFFVGDIYALGRVGVKKDLPLGKRYLELGSAQGDETSVALLLDLRKCASCGKLDVHHTICAWCRNVRYCDKGCQLEHWQRSVDPHKPHCGRRREVVLEAGGSSSEIADLSADSDQRDAGMMAAAAATGAAEEAVAAAEAAAARAEAAVVVEKEKAAAAVTASEAALAKTHVAAAAATAARDEAAVAEAALAAAGAAAVAAEAEATAAVAAAAVAAAPTAGKNAKKRMAKIMEKMEVALAALEAATRAAEEAGVALQLATLYMDEAAAARTAIV